MENQGRPNVLSARTTTQIRPIRLIATDCLPPIVERQIRRDRTAQESQDRTAQGACRCQGVSSRWASGATNPSTCVSTLLEVGIEFSNRLSAKDFRDVQIFA